MRISFDNVQIDKSKDNIIEYTGEQGITQIQQPTEVGEAIERLNDTEYDEKRRVSKIDLVTRLSSVQAMFIAQYDIICRMGIVDKNNADITDPVKRLAVSIGGAGRSEIVQIVGAKQDRDVNTAGGTMWERMKGVFGGNKQ